MEKRGRRRPRVHRELIAEASADVHAGTNPAPSRSMQELRAAASAEVETRRRRRRRAGRIRQSIVVLGLLLIVAGIVVIAVPLWAVHQRGQADSQALNDWNHGGAQALAGPVGVAAAPAACSAT